MSGEPNGQMNGVTFEIIRMLGEVREGIRGVRSDLWVVYHRLEDGERQMNFLSEENVRRQKDIEALALARKDKPEPASPLLRLGSAVYDLFWELLSEKKDLRRWLILAFLAWATNFLHLPAMWHDAAQSAIEHSE